MLIRIIIFSWLSLTTTFAQVVITKEINEAYLESGVLLLDSISIHNSSADDQELTIIKRSTKPTDSWSISFCTDLCLPDFIDSTTWIIRSDSLQYLSIDVLSAEAGEARVELDFLLGDSLIEHLTLSYHLVTNTPLIVNSEQIITTFNQSYVQILIADHSQLKVFNISPLGQKDELKFSLLENSILIPKEELTSPWILISTTDTQKFYRLIAQ